MFFYPDRVTYRTPEFYQLQYDEVYFDSKDSTRLHAWHIYPHASSKQAKAVYEGDVSSKGLIFIAHGNAQNLSSHFVSWVWLVEEGYELFIFDYRGYGKSEGESGLKGSIEDTKAALDYLQEHYKKDYFVCGQSLGGTLLLNALAQRDNARIKAVVIDSTFRGFADIASDKMDQAWLSWPFQWIPYLSMSRDHDAMDRVPQISRPLLFLHGSLDRVVSPNNSWQLFDAASRPREFWLVKGSEHTQALENETVRKDFLEFLKKEANHYDNLYSRMRIYE